VTLAVAYGLVARDNASSTCLLSMKMKRLFLVFTNQDQRQFMDAVHVILIVAGICVIRKDIYCRFRSISSIESFKQVNLY